MIPSVPGRAFLSSEERLRTEFGHNRLLMTLLDNPLKSVAFADYVLRRVVSRLASCGGGQ